MTEGGDIGFRVYFKSAEEGPVDLVPLSRIESHLVTEEGELICVNPGKCKQIYHWIMNPYYDHSLWFHLFCYLDVVVFDNTFSMLRSKKLRYHIVIIDCPASESQTTAAVVGWE
jgi:hypothetical protein